MRKYLKSLMVAVTGIALIGSAAYAFEGRSIKSENTFDFYENEFDFMLMPAKLAGHDSTLGEGHKLVEGFTGYRLFPNLTNQPGYNAYQIGGIIPIPNGLGNIGILFDYRKDEGNGPALDCVNCGKAYLNPVSTTDLYNRDWELAFGLDESLLEGDEESSTEYTDLLPYDGSADALDYTSFDNTFDTNEDEAWNLYVGYVLAIPNTPFSVGVSYTYGSIEGDANRSQPELEIFNNTADTTPGSSYNVSSVDGEDNSNWDYEAHDFAVEARYNASPLDSLLGVAWRTSDGQNSFNDNSSINAKATNRLINANPNITPFNTEVLNSGIYSSYSQTLSESDSGDAFFPFCGWGNRDGDRWSIYTENIFELNPTVAFGLDVAYRMGEYDDNLDGSYDIEVDESGRRAGTGVTEIGTRDSRETFELNGDIDNDELDLRGELRLTFPKVRFGLGIGYNNFSEDGNYDGRSVFTETVVYDDSTLSTSAGFTQVSTATGSQEIDYSIDQQTWRLPVSTEFNITERLVGRLGVEFVYGDWEMEVENREVFEVNESSVTTYENGDQVFGPIDNAGAAYDDDDNIETFKLTDDDTFSNTIYNVGLGYQVTENLNVDAMWRHSDDHQEGEPVKREAISTDLLFVGATLAF